MQPTMETNRDLHASAPVASDARTGARPNRARLTGLVLLLAAGSGWVGGCATGIGASRPSVQSIEIAGQIQIRRDLAHATFQEGRQVSGPNRTVPYCELEVGTVAQQPTVLPRERLRVTGERQTLLKDTITRIPALLAGMSCSDAVYQETIWYLQGDAGSDFRHLRCIAPYFNCLIGPPLSPAQAQAVVGPVIRVSPAGETNAAPTSGAGGG